MEDYILRIALDFKFTAKPDEACDLAFEYEQEIKRKLETLNLFAVTDQDPDIGEGVLIPQGRSERGK